METEMMKIRSTGKSVDEAIFKGLQQLGISIDEVSIDIIQTETKGILGIGAKPAIVELTQKPADEFEVPDYMRRYDDRDRNRDNRKPDRRRDRAERNGRDSGRKDEKAEKVEKAEKTEKKTEPVKEKKPERRKNDEQENVKKPAPAAKNETVKKDDTAAAKEEAAEKEEKPEKPERKQKPRSDRRRRERRAENPAEKTEPAEKPEETENAGINAVDEKAEPAEEKKLVYTLEAAEGNPAAEFVKGLVEHMGATGQVLAAQDDDCLRLRIDSEMMGMLIGHRGETLDAMQYLTGLVINKNRKTEGYTRVTLNTEEYREKREETLKKLARKVASQVRATGRARALEPMNPYERRVLHSALQNNPDVTTHSEGEEPNRRVVVSPRRLSRSGGYSRPRGGRRSADRGERRTERRPRPERREEEPESIDMEKYNELLEAARKGVVSRHQYEEMFSTETASAPEKNDFAENHEEISVENFENS